MDVPSALTRWPKYPELGQHNLRDARLYADRADLIAALPIPRGGKVAEIGVWRAAFSKVLVGRLAPRQFIAFDIFTGHTLTEWNGLTGHQLFDGLTHRQYYEREMAPFRDVMTVVEGPSADTLRAYTDRSFDLVYVDGAHDYDAVKGDAELAVQMTAATGFLVFNDYLLLDHNNAAYGIVPVVNDLVVNHGWYVVGFALNHGLYADIALQRAQPETPSEEEGTGLLTPFRAALKKTFGRRKASGSVERRHYQERGYQTFRSALPLDKVDALAGAARQLVPYRGKVVRQNSTISVNDFFPDTEIIRNSPANLHLPLTEDLAPLSSALQELVTCRAVADCLMALDGAESYMVHQTLIFFASQTTELHIDSWGLDTAPRGYAHTLWIPLQDMEPRSGVPAVVPWPLGKVVTEAELGLAEAGSIGERHDRYHQAFSRKILGERPEVATFFPRRGDFIVWSSLTPHLTLMSHPFPRQRLSLQVLLKPVEHRRGNFLEQPPSWFRERSIRVNDRFSLFVPETLSQEFGIAGDPM